MTFLGQDQMRFNLQTPANPMNMATRFSLRPTPIVLQRVPSSAPSSQSTAIPNPMPFEERMKIASRLAQREIERNSLYCPLPCAASMTDCEKVKSDIAFNTDEGKKSTTSDQLQTSRNTRHRTSAVIAKKPSKEKPAKPATCPPSLCKVETKQLHMGAHAELKEEVNEEGVESEINKTAHEIVKLRKDLTRKMQKLKLLSLRADLAPPPVVATGSGSSSRGGRLSWVEEEKEEERREKKKRKEQTARSNRMLYQLQQKVREAQRGIKGPSKYNQKEKLLAMNRLASAHRAAVRTLHHLISMGVTQGTTHGSAQRVTSRNELNEMVEQLSRLCVEAQVPKNGGEDSGDEQLISLLRELSEYHAQVKQSLNQEQYPNLHNVAPPQTKTKSSRRKNKPKQQMQPRGVLVHPKFRSKKSVFIKRDNNGERDNEVVPHFAKQTFASTQKRSPKKDSNFPPSSFTYSQQPPHPLLSLSDPPPNHEASHPSHHSSHSSQPSSPCSSVSSHSNVPPASPPPSCSSSDVMTQPSLVRKGDNTNKPPPMPWEQEGQNIVEREMARQTWLDTRAIELAQKKEKRLSEQAKHKSCREKKERKTQNQLMREETELNNHTGLMSVNENPGNTSAGNVNQETVKETDRRVSREEEPEGLTFQRPGLENMIERIQEMEKERDALRSKWQSVSYGSSAGSGPHVNVVRPSADIREPISVPFSNEQVAKLQEYRERYSHYLKLTGVRTDGGFDPWRLVDQICEEIFDELLLDTALEIQSTVDSCVEQVFDAEFQCPAD